VPRPINQCQEKTDGGWLRDPFIDLRRMLYQFIDRQQVAACRYVTAQIYRHWSRDLTDAP